MTGDDEVDKQVMRTVSTFANIPRNPANVAQPS